MKKVGASVIEGSSILNSSNWLVLSYDTISVVFSWFLAHWLLYNLSAVACVQAMHDALKILPIVLVVHIFFYRGFSTYRPLWRFSSLPELIRLSKALLSAWLVNIVIFFTSQVVPTAVWMSYPLFLFSFLILGRLIIRSISDVHKVRTAHLRKILIVGAGKGAELFLRDLEQWAKVKYIPIAMLDDNPKLWGKEIRGVPILGSTDYIEKVVLKYPVDLIVIAIPSLTGKGLKRLLQKCEGINIPVRSLPSLEAITSGKISSADLQEISLENLLGRELIHLNRTQMKEFLFQKTVLITGGGGSIGSELCRQMISMGPAHLIIADQSEFNLYQIEIEMRALGCRNIEVVLLDVTDSAAVAHTMKRYQPSIVFHAAAYKHVPMLESHIREAVKNNVIGTKILVEASVRYGVEKFIMVSTDKAVNPANVMGATKRVAEIFCQAYHEHYAQETRFVVVRFGNVVGSAGSVVPLFKQQLAKGGPITVTDPLMVRYFMTIPEASQLVLQAGAMGVGGEIFVLDMGEPIKIVELAKQLIRLSGKTEEEIGIIYTGLRPGEKLYEELFYSQETLTPTTQEKIFKANATTVTLHSWEEMCTLLKILEQACDEYREDLLTEVLAEFLGDEGKMLNAGAPGCGSSRVLHASPSLSNVGLEPRGEPVSL